MKKLEINKNQEIWQWLILISLSLAIIVSLYFYFRPKADYRKIYDPKLISLEQEIQSYKKQLGTGNNYIAYNRLANAYIRQARVTGDPSWYILAEQNAKSSLYQSPVNNYSALLSLSSINMAKHEFNEARKNAKELLNDSSTKLEALGIIFDANYAVGDLPACKKNIEEINKAKIEIYKVDKAIVKPEDFIDMVNSIRQALLEYSQGNLKESEKFFLKAIKDSIYSQGEPKAWVYNLYANFLIKNGRIDEAKQNIQFALNYVPNYTAALMQKAQLAKQENQWQDVNNILNEINNRITRSDVLLKLAESEKNLNHQEKYSELIKKAKKLLDDESADGGFGHRRDYIKLLLDENTKSSLSLALKKAQSEKKLRKDLDTLNIVAETEIKNNTTVNL